MSTNFPGAPPVPPDDGRPDTRNYLAGLARVINLTQGGKLNCLATLTLATSTTITTITDTRIGATTVPVPIPTTANAAAALTNLYPSSVGKQTATFTHASTTTTDRIYNLILIG